MKKNNYSLSTLVLLFVCIFSIHTRVHAEEVKNTVPFSYIILGEVGSSTIQATQNNFVSSINFSCNIAGYVCLTTSSSTNTAIEGSFTEMDSTRASSTLQAVQTKRLQDKANMIQDTATSTILLDAFGFSIPKDATYVTHFASTSVAYYTTTGTYGIKNTRLYNLQYIQNGAIQTRSYEEKVQKGWDLVSDLTVLFGFTEDGTKLVYVSDRDGNTNLYYTDLTTNPKDLKGIQLTKEKHTIMTSAVAGDYVYFISNKDKKYRYDLYRIKLAKGSKIEKIADSVMYTNDLAVVGGQVIYTKDVQGVGELYAYNTQNKKNSAFSGINYPKIITGTYARIDTKTIRGILMPSQHKTKIAILWLHGGPYRQVGVERHSYGSYALYDYMLEEARAAGATVLKLDYTGSSGYGSGYANAIVNTIGKTDLQDMKNALSYLKKQGYSDVYLFGTSYGGYMSLLGGVSLDTQVKGAISTAAVTDWAKLMQDVGATPFEVDFNGQPNETNKKLYDQSSILDKVTASKKSNLVVMYGNKDTQVPYDQSVYFYTEAIKKGLQNIRLVELSNEKHVIKGLAQANKVCTELKTMTKLTKMQCLVNQ